MPEPLAYATKSDDVMPMWVRVHGWLVIAMGPVAILSLAILAWDHFWNHGWLDRHGPIGFVPVGLAAFFSPILIIAAKRHWHGLVRRNGQALKTALWIETIGAGFVSFGAGTNLLEALASNSPSPLFIGIAFLILITDGLFAIGIWQTIRWFKRWPADGVII